MFFAQRTAGDFERLPIELFFLLVAALGVVSNRQVTHALEGSRMLFAQRAAADFERLAVESFRLLVTALV